MNSSDIESLAPGEVATYLVSAGWVERQRAPHAVIWSHGAGDDEVELLLPLNPAYRDYQARLLETVRTIALTEDREPREVLADLATLTVDTQHFRLLPDLPAGTIRLMDIVDVTRGVRDLMFTAAHATVDPAPMLVQPRTRPPGVSDFVRGVRLVTPTAGSFILSVHVPVGGPSPSRTPRQSSSQPPFNRQVSLRLHQAVAATWRAAEEATERDTLLPFADRASDGVSADLCRALSLVGQAQPFELRFAWAQSLPVQRERPGMPFDRLRLTAIRSAADELPRMATDSAAVIIGRVIRLDRAGESSGTVIVHGRQELSSQGPDLRVSVSLPADLYDVAVLAHRSRRPVRVAGSLRGNELHSVTALELLD